MIFAVLKEKHMHKANDAVYAWKRTTFLLPLQNV